MKEKAIHYLPAGSTWTPCGRYGQMVARSTDHKPSITCQRCLVALDFNPTFGYNRKKED